MTFKNLSVIIVAFIGQPKTSTRRSAAGSALRSGRKGRGFESRRLDQKAAEHEEVRRGFFAEMFRDGIRGWEPRTGVSVLPYGVGLNIDLRGKRGN